MNPSASILQLPQRLTFAALLSLGVACGSSAEPAGERQQPISQDGSELSAGDACAGGVAPETAAEGECLITARNLCFASREAACACAGCGIDECAIAESFPEQAVCPSEHPSSDPDRPVSDDPDAPVSQGPGGGVSGSPGSGCVEPGSPGGGVDPSPGARCDFIVGDACFDSAESACASAGCDVDGCLVLESYPAQIRCL